MVLRGSSDTTKEIEILVLRHQPAVVRRRPPRPRMNGTDHALIAALTRPLPVCWPPPTVTTTARFTVTT
jgi:putative transposase